MSSVERSNAGSFEAEELVFQGPFLFQKFDNSLHYYRDVGVVKAQLYDAPGSLPYLDVTSIEDDLLLLRAELFRGMEAAFDGHKRQLKLCAGDIGDVRRYRLDGCEVERLCAAVVTRANLLQYRPDIPPADQISNFVDKCDEFRAAAMLRTAGLWWVPANGPTATCDHQPIVKPLQDAETQEAPVEVKSGNDEKVNIGSLLTVCDDSADELQAASPPTTQSASVKSPALCAFPGHPETIPVEQGLFKAEFHLREFTTGTETHPLGTFTATFHSEMEPASIEFTRSEDGSLVLRATVDETLSFEANETTWTSFRFSGYDELNTPKLHLAVGRPEDVRRVKDLVNPQERPGEDTVDECQDNTANGKSAGFPCADCDDTFRSHRALQHHERDRHGRPTPCTSTTGQTTKRRQTTDSSASSTKLPKVDR